ncbi:hypothetical protein EV195_10271 [Tenacibaculum skagerrakense]|uniref:Uncharacterized protein n=1 Tax=Tenacibaculum skagerrakense TaxID=186571 RepID=A0A4R2NX30_9FLAO|nr:hypothetical protein [Tenacibaculum skagerrakense]TCP26733.1 hypothetical protein EV195_10271 [Tenacibaculum skagerrakense]
MDYIKLNLINKSNDTNNSNIVIFQKNVASDYDETAVAWKVIKNFDKLDNHSFMFPVDFEISVSDSYGNYTNFNKATNGQTFGVTKDYSGDVLNLLSEPTKDKNQVEIQNNLTSGAVNANCYKDGKLLAVKTGISPGQKAFFEFHPRIYIGLISQIEEGDIINSAILSEINTVINLFGISGADIVMTGGGSGKKSSSFNFVLENINQ